MLKHVLFYHETQIEFLFWYNSKLLSWNQGNWVVYLSDSFFSDKQSQGKGSKSGKSKGKSEKESAFASSLEDTDENDHFIGRKSFFS